MTQPRQQHSDPQSDAAHSASRWEERYASVEQLWSGRPAGRPVTAPSGRRGREGAADLSSEP